MTKNKLLELIVESIEENKMFESLMLDGNNQQTDEVSREIARILYCENHAIKDDGCRWCVKFRQKQILDYHVVGNHFDAISKEEITSLIDKLNFSSIEIDKPKVILIRNAEDLKVDAANALLKFLEEPTRKTFFILQTNDKNAVLPTIKSRTKIFNLSNENENKKQITFLTKIIRSKNEQNILLFNNKMKKMDKNELQQLLNDSINDFLNAKDLKIYEYFLELINDLKFMINSNLAIDNFLIKVARESYEGTQ